MDLYKKEGFNPFDMMIGCLPWLLVQTPVFMALYWVLQGSVELRLQPFMLWVNDLSAADPWFILPILFGISMWGMQKISSQSATMDPTQQKVMQLMPVMLTGLFLFLPAGVVLYSVVSNVISLLQQLWFNRVYEAQEAKAALLTAQRKAEKRK